MHRIAKPRERCVVTTIDQMSGEQGKEPLKILATLRNRDGNGYFGQNLIPLGRGTIRRRDPIHILE